MTRPFVALPYEVAVEIGSKYYFELAPCRRGHQAPRLVSAKKCTACLAERAARHYAKNRDAILARKRETSTDRREYLRDYRKRSQAMRRTWYQENRQRLLSAAAEYRRKNPDRIADYRRWYAAKHPDRLRLASLQWRSQNKEHLKVYMREYRAENAALFAQHAARRRARNVLAEPAWLSDSEKRRIALIYQLSRTKSQWTGVPHEVDHVVPLAGEDVCGLHVPWNLKVIPAADNRAKCNNFE